MEIQDLQEHLSCHCYDSSEHPVVELIKIVRGEVRERVFRGSKIVFIMEGSLLMELQTGVKAEAVKGDFVFAATGVPFRYKAKKNSLVMLVAVQGSLRMCRGFDIGSLYSGKNRPKGLYHADKEFIPLKMNEMMWTLATALNRAVELRMMCKQYFELKIQEFFILLRVFYTKDQLRDFLYYALSPDMVFSEFVKSNWLKYNTVQNLSQAMNLSTQHFTKRFKRVFAMPPGEWIQEQKKQYILKDIQENRKTFQQISADYDFTAVPNFNRFCRKVFGKTPNQIRHESGKVLK